MKRNLAYIALALAVIPVCIAGNYFAFTFNLWLHEWIGG